MDCRWHTVYISWKLVVVPKFLKPQNFKTTFQKYLTCIFLSLRANLKKNSLPWLTLYVQLKTHNAYLCCLKIQQPILYPIEASWKYTLKKHSLFRMYLFIIVYLFDYILNCFSFRHSQSKKKLVQVASEPFTKSDPKRMGNCTQSKLHGTIHILRYHF